MKPGASGSGVPGLSRLDTGSIVWQLDAEAGAAGGEPKSGGPVPASDRYRLVCLLGQGGMVRRGR